MKFKLFLLSLIALVPMLAFAQGGSLTIFSEDGDKFTLYLNGAQQNNVPQTNLRLDGLSQPYYKAKIVFEDKAKNQIEKNLSATDPQTNQPSDVVYRIKNKDGDMKLRYFSAQPIQSNYVPPADMHVVHYGQPDQVTTVQTTVTTTNPGNGGGSVTIGTGNGGVNMNVTLSDPNNNNNVTTTTTTTRTTSTSQSMSFDNPATQQPSSPACQYPMAPASFWSAKETVAKAAFEDTKLSTAKTILSSNCMSTEQVIQICNEFGFEQSKLDFAKYAYSKTTDPGNYFKVGNIFSFDASKTDLNNYISSNPR